MKRVGISYLLLTPNLNNTIARLTATAKTAVDAPVLKTHKVKNCWTHDHGLFGLEKEQKEHAHDTHTSETSCGSGDDEGGDERRVHRKTVMSCGVPPSVFRPCANRAKIFACLAVHLYFSIDASALR